MTSNPNLNQPNSRRVTATYNIPISLLLQGCLRLFLRSPLTTTKHLNLHRLCRSRFFRRSRFSREI